MKKEILIIMGLIIVIGLMFYYIYPLDVHCVCEDGNFIFGHIFGGYNKFKTFNCNEWCDGNGRRCAGLDIDCQLPTADN